MKCPLCKLEGRIVASRYVIEGDNSKDTETKLFIEQDIKCVNKNCNNNDKIFETVKNPLNLG